MNSPNNEALSVVIIAHQEQDRIERCITHVLDIAAEVIVIIQDQDDPTGPLASQLGAIVIVNPWRGYAEQRNFALTHARQEWILQLDADEVVTSELSASIREFVRDQSHAYSSASFFGIDFFYNRWLLFGGARRKWKSRLVRKDHSQWTGGLVHEHQQISGDACHLEGLIHHYSNRSLDHMEKKINHYANLFVAQRVAEGRTKTSTFSALIRPAFKFVQSYILRFGFLDGFAGYLYARYRSHYTFMKYSRLREYAINEQYRTQIDKTLSKSSYKRKSRLHGADRLSNSLARLLNRKQGH